MLVAGWKPCSLVDVYGATSFTLWLCGCNLRCPFCHNWRVAEADGSVCREVSVDKIVEELATSRAYVDYVHATGGEPLLQHAELRRLFVDAKSLGVRTSLNSNLTMPERLAVTADVLDHAATDAKIPHLMYGVSRWKELYGSFLESLRILGELGVLVELRVPLVRANAEEYLRVISDALSKASRAYVVINRVLCEPAVSPRDSGWCRSHLLTDDEYAKLAHAVADFARSLGVKTYILHPPFIK